MCKPKAADNCKPTVIGTKFNQSALPATIAEVDEECHLWNAKCDCHHERKETFCTLPRHFTISTSVMAGEEAAATTIAANNTEESKTSAPTYGQLIILGYASTAINGNQEGINKRRFVLQQKPIATGVKVMSQFVALTLYNRGLGGPIPF